MKPIIKKKVLNSSGREVLSDATENDIKGLSIQSKLCSTANNLSNLTPEEKNAWALDMKMQANELFKNKFYDEASNKYLEVKLI